MYQIKIYIDVFRDFEATKCLGKGRTIWKWEKGREWVKVEENIHNRAYYFRVRIIWQIKKLVHQN